MDINNTYANQERLRKIMLNLPEICHKFFMSRSSTTSILTRINYATDLQTFFEYIIKVRADFDLTIPESISMQHIRQITAYDIEGYLDYLTAYYKDSKELTNKNSGKKRKLCALRTFYKYLLKHQEIAEDPTALVDTPKIKDKPIIRLEMDEIRRLIEVVNQGEGLSKRQLAYHRKTLPRDNAIIYLLLGTGIRLSELIGIDLKDLHLENNSFLVTRKGGNQTILYYSDEVKEVLLEYHEQRIHVNPQDGHQSALFLSLQNRRITHRAVENIIKKYTQVAAPLKKITPHKLRSTYGTHLYKNTGDIYLVAEVLGHKDVNTTKKHYAAISDDRKKSAPDYVKLND